jgi:hypothetical protein
MRPRSVGSVPSAAQPRSRSRSGRIQLEEQHPGRGHGAPHESSLRKRSEPAAAVSGVGEVAPAARADRGCADASATRRASGARGRETSERRGTPRRSDRGSSPTRRAVAAATNSLSSAPRTTDPALDRAVDRKGRSSAVHDRRLSEERDPEAQRERQTQIRPLDGTSACRRTRPGVIASLRNSADPGSSQFLSSSARAVDPAAVSSMSVMCSSPFRSRAGCRSRRPRRDGRRAPSARVASRVHRGGGDRRRRAR